MEVPLGSSSGLEARRVSWRQADQLVTESSHRADASRAGAKRLAASGHRPFVAVFASSTAFAFSMRSARRPRPLLRSLRTGKATSTPQEGSEKAAFWSICLVAVYISCDVGVNLCSEAASQGYQKASAVLVTSLVSAVIGAVWAVRQDGWRGLQQCVAPENVFYRSNFFASVLFACSSISLLKAFEKQSAAFIKLVGQLKLPLAAFLARYFLGK
ncbi:unnamed protein product, partial [Symbiodinium necroappetens]